MADKINPRELLAELGLAGLSPQAANEVLRLFYAVLELRVGKRLARVLGPAALAAAENLFNESSPSARTEDDRLRYLEEKVPEYGQYVALELERTKQEFVQRLSDDTTHKVS